MCPIWGFPQSPHPLPSSPNSIEYTNQNKQSATIDMIVAAPIVGWAAINTPSPTTKPTVIITIPRQTIIRSVIAIPFWGLPPPFGGVGL